MPKHQASSQDLHALWRGAGGEPFKGNKASQREERLELGWEHQPTEVK